LRPFPALLLGAVQLAAPKGTLPHRTLGWVWVALMATTALSSFRFVWGPGRTGLGPIVILSVVTLVSMVFLVRHARRGRIKAHRRGALWPFVTALVITGTLTLLPGRLMHCLTFAAPGTFCPPAPL
jgi:uncharacterized membrane protein